ncbi:hypothetical protein [Pseudomonas syringae]|uniref:hypothetical protein n=1 Tax=Pseudomonas syringae TaxID=317 RepID=UPI0004636502|nr:hypothetical protein [Pseudomonas syringae]UOF19506.1 hypothetical protein N023_23295 [Pseudomonas syringae CC440]UZA81902.1 hypothetical protein EZZ79_24285 [Pseudomonas syringae]
MGQAKDRGPIEKRLAQSVEAKRRVAESLELVRRNLDELREELGLPSGAPFLGYVVHIPESDEFLANFNGITFASYRSWTKNPAMARRFEDFIDAYILVQKDIEIVVGLFETDDQFIVAGIL